MDIPITVKNSILQCQVTDESIGYCVDSCIRQSWKYLENVYALNCEKPANKKRIRYHENKVKEWENLADQFLAFIEPDLIYVTVQVIGEEEKRQYYKQYKIDKFLFSRRTEKPLEDSDQVTKTDDDWVCGTIGRNKPFSMDFCKFVLYLLNQHGRYQPPSQKTEPSGGYEHENTR